MFGAAFFFFFFFLIKTVCRVFSLGGGAVLRGKSAEFAGKAEHFLRLFCLKWHLFSSKPSGAPSFCQEGLLLTWLFPWVFWGFFCMHSHFLGSLRGAFLKAGSRQLCKLAFSVGLFWEEGRVVLFSYLLSGCKSPFAAQMLSSLLLWFLFACVARTGVNQKLMRNIISSSSNSNLAHAVSIQITDLQLSVGFSPPPSRASLNPAPAACCLQSRAVLYLKKITYLHRKCLHVPALSPVQWENNYTTVLKTLCNLTSATPNNRRTAGRYLPPH